MTQIQLLNDSINLHLKRIEKLTKKVSLYTQLYTIDDDFKYLNHVYYNVLIKLFSLLKNIKRNQKELLFLVSTVRYIFETLVQIELIKKEPDYLYKFVYSIYNHQIDKTQKIYDTLLDEIKLLDKLIIKENTLMSELHGTIKADKNKIKELSQKINKVKSEIDSEIDKNTYMFLTHYEIMGLSAIRAILIKEFKPKYQKLIIDLKKQQTDKAKVILKKKFISDLFDFRNQHSKVFKELKDDRSWTEKAGLVGMANDYKTMYDYTSALIHSTSYSIFTQANIDDTEIGYNLNFINQYLTKILNNVDCHLNNCKIKIVKNK